MKESKGVYKAIFAPKKEDKPTIFGVEVSEDRFSEVLSSIYDKQGDWKPRANNAFELYLKAGSEWSKVDASDIKKKENIWEGMPQELIDYIRSLPEFNAELFEWHTGIKANNENATRKAEILKKIAELKAEADKLIS